MLSWAKTQVSSDKSKFLFICFNFMEDKKMKRWRKSPTYPKKAKTVNHWDRGVSLPSSQTFHKQKSPSGTAAALSTHFSLPPVPPERALGKFWELDALETGADTSSPKQMLQESMSQTWSNNTSPMKHLTVLVPVLSLAQITQLLHWNLYH